MAFFSKFPKTYYDTKNDSVLRVVTDIFRNVDVNDLLLDTGVGAYTFTEIQDGERPDVMSFRLYGTTDYYWTFFILNDSLKEGIGHSWPLSSHQLEDGFQRHYDPYEVLVFLPQQSEDPETGSIGQGNTFSSLPITEENLQFLRLRTISVIPGAPVRTSKIFKWDDTMLQLWVTESDGDLSGYSSYQISWVNPYEEETDEYDENEILRLKFVSDCIEVFKVTDPAGYASLLALAADLGSTPSEFQELSEAYVFDKIYTRAQHWDSARNAAARYFSPDDETDILTPLDAGGSSNYISYFDLESAENESRTKIRTVNPRSITEFASNYFTLLNSN